MTYADFLTSKAQRHQPTGHHINPNDIHHSLHEWQNRIVQWATARGRCAIFADTGLGKTRMQLEWARHMGTHSLILAPLSVARQTVREANKIDTTCTYIRRPDEITGPGTYITNYELAHHFNPATFDAVALDESSILKSFTGSTRNALIKQWRNTPHRSSWSATPAPNDVTELCNQAEFLGVMPRQEMLAAYFVHDDTGWRLKGHATDPMFRWMSNRGETILTPFAGIGSEVYTAVRLSRHGIGCELKPSYWRTAVDNLRRLDDEMSLPTLFDND